MIDARRILEDLARQASDLAKDPRVEARLGDAKSAAQKVRERLETDPKARTVAAGAGGLLLLGMLGSEGGRKFLGAVAKTGIAAGLGALAYKAWAERHGRAGAAAEPDADALKESGYLIDVEKDPEFASALVHAMLGAAYADGELDTRERVAIDAALIRSGASEEDRRELLSNMPEKERIALIKKGARSPNHAAELFAAAVVTAGEQSTETAFLGRLADALGIHPEHAAAIPP
ncbi:MAG: DUF533 domain-containing protein, partial [Parvularculaceae bacterium]|nr:DUF533 domain-containing protein [Parvularculaceae bacterium]